MLIKCSLDITMNKILCIFSFFLTGCSGTWVWQEEYPKHKTMSFNCPKWNYNEAYDRLHHAWSTQQHVPVKIKKVK